MSFFFLFPFTSDSKLALEAPTSRFNRLNQSIYIQLGGFFFFFFFLSFGLYVCVCVGGGIRQVRALMILKWRGPESALDSVAAVAARCRLLRVFLVSLPLFIRFIYRFIALHSYIHTRSHTWNTYQQQPFHFCRTEYLADSLSLSLLFFQLALLVLFCYIFNSLL